MKIQKGFKFRIYPTEEQRVMLLQQGGNARFLWNYLLKNNTDYYKETKKFKFFYEMSMSIPKLKKEFDFLNLSFSQSLQTVARQLDRALRDSFRSNRGFPKFKKKKDNDSFTCPQGWKLKKSFVHIPKIGEVRWIKHRSLQGKPKHITVLQDGNRWYCSVTCEFEIREKEKKANNLVGVDLGLNAFATLSDGTIIINPKHMKRYEEKLVREQRRLSRKQKGSVNRNKQRKKVHRIHQKIKDVRLDFLHKLTSHMIAKYDGVVVEDLNISGMMRNHHLAKSVADVAWSEFVRQLEYKALWNSKYFLKIDKFYPSSKTCSRCGWKNEELTLSDRVFNCKVCGFSLDRDLNAAINIHRLGASQINACGEDKVTAPLEQWSSLKQEKEEQDNLLEAYEL
jgi:putative transposase